jgi:hypothetical protein
MNRAGGPWFGLIGQDGAGRDHRIGCLQIVALHTLNLDEVLRDAPVLAPVGGIIVKQVEHQARRFGGTHNERSHHDIDAVFPNDAFDR